MTLLWQFLLLPVEIVIWFVVIAWAVIAWGMRR